MRIYAIIATRTSLNCTLKTDKTPYYDDSSGAYLSGSGGNLWKLRSGNRCFDALQLIAPHQVVLSFFFMLNIHT